MKQGCTPMDVKKNIIIQYHAYMCMIEETIKVVEKLRKIEREKKKKELKKCHKS